MKNNRKYLIVVAMLVLLAVVLFMGGSTYAKYLTQKDVATEQATVAKWGYVITENAEKFFGTDYTKGEENTATVVADGSGASISAFSTTKVVAPGASGFMTLDINGKAEVLSKITFTVTGGLNESVRNEQAEAIQLTHANGAALNPVYEPIKWTVTSAGDTTLDNLPTNATLAQLETWLEGLNTEFAAVTPNTNINIELTISWVWAFEQQNNAYDTMLGDLATGDADLLTTKYATNTPVGVTVMNFNLNVTVEQIQD